jgi:hypothetical protein
MTIATVAVSPVTDSAEWDRFVARSAQGSVFCTAGFLAALDREAELWRLGDDWSAGAILFREPDGRVAQSPLPFTMYQGVLLGADVEAMPVHRRVRESLDRVAAVLEGLAEQGALSFCLHPSLADVRAFSWFHHHAPDQGRFAVEVRYSGRIAVSPAAGIDGFLAQSTTLRRRDYRKAAAHFEVEPSTDLELLDRLHRLTFARQGVERSAREATLLRAITARALADGFGELLIARDRTGRPAGAVVFLFDRGAGYYLVGANDPAFRADGVSTLLFAAGVGRCLTRGIAVIDVVGMNSPARGDFKTSFGAVPVPYYVATWRKP